MAESDGPAVAGELVVQNGKYKGQRIPLTVPVTVIGAAEWCDVRLTGEGVGDVHCVVSVTPAGPALRTWHPEQTRVNAAPATAALLADGDTLTVGPCRFQLAWPHSVGDAPLTVPDEREVMLLPEGAFDLVGWQRSLHAQEQALAELIEARHRQIGEWFEELTDHREELRLYRARQESYVARDKAKAKKLRAAAKRLRDGAAQDRQRARTLYSRFLKRLKGRWSAERRAVEAERAELGRARRRLEADRSRFESERESFTAEADAYHVRLRDAWQLLTDGQRRLLADRQESERTLGRQQEVLDRRVTEVKAQEQALEAARGRGERRVQELLAEISRLEVRASHVRAAVQNLETHRGNLEVSLTASGVGEPFDDRVALDAPPAPVEDLMAGLMAQRHDLDREQRALAATRAELERRSDDLTDQRAVLAEQLAALVIARQTWVTTECQTVDELEALARDLNGREVGVVERERELACVEGVLRKRADELETLRERLEGWQAALATHETYAASARERAETELQARRDHLTRWERALAELCRKWSAVRRRDVERLRGELARCAEARVACQTREVELDRQQAQLAGVAARVAEIALAVQSAEQRLMGSERPRLARRALRVHRRQWESHFGKLMKKLTARQEAVAAERVAADDRLRDLARLTAEAAERGAAVTGAEQAAESARLARERELEERATTLSIEEARAKRTEQDLAAARAEVERVTAALRSRDKTSLPEPVLLLSLPSAA